LATTCGLLALLALLCVRDDFDFYSPAGGSSAGAVRTYSRDTDIPLAFAVGSSDLFEILEDAFFVAIGGCASIDVSS